MTDLWKVIKAIEICYFEEHNCTECELFYVEDCNDKLMRDVLELLKDQEAKLLTFDEVEKHFFVPKELFGGIEEYINYVNDIEPLYMECRVEDAFVCHWRTHDNISMHLADWKNDYNKTWRCWTKKPTQEQMKAVKWDD